MTKAVSRWAVVSALAAMALTCHAEEAPRPDISVPATIGGIERVDARLDAIVPAGAKLEILADGHLWTEGPVWVAELGSLLYSDIPNNAIYRWKEGDGASLWLEPTGDTAAVDAGGQGGSNGLVIDRAGRLILAQHGDRRVARLAGSLDTPRPRFDTLADKYQGRRLNSPNDMALRSNGDLYFTDPPYGLAGGDEDPAKALDVNGVYRLAADGTLTRVVTDLPRPNGIAFSPDETVLYVADSDRDRAVIMAYAVRPDGGLGDGRVLFESWGDGMAVDRDGNLYVAGPGEGVIILSPDGDLLGSLKTTQATSNCAFGDDGSTLYITSGAYLLRVHLSTTGVGF